MKKRSILPLILLLTFLISACQAENPLSEKKAEDFLVSLGYKEITILGEVDTESNCTDSNQAKAYKFEGTFLWTYSSRTHRVEGVICGKAKESIAIWSSAAGEVARNLPESTNK